MSWEWGIKEQSAFEKVKTMLCSDIVLAHFDPSLLIGIACDASSVGIGAVLFHRYKDGRERPIANASKTLTETHGIIAKYRKRLYQLYLLSASSISSFMEGNSL